jgi:hypothetical protein
MGATTTRLDDELTEKLRLYRACTGRAANDLIAGLVREFFECQGDTEIAEALTERAKRQHGPALNELGDR